MIAITDTERWLVESIIKSRIPVCRVIAFGSRVNGTNSSASDLDIAIDSGDNQPVPVWDIREDFMESDIPFKVDVLDYQSISDSFRKIIDKQNEELFDTRRKIDL